MAKKKFTSPLANANSTNSATLPKPSGAESSVMETNSSSNNIPYKGKKLNKKLNKPSKAQKQASAPLRLNKRLRRLERAAQIKAMAAAHTVASTEVKQENLSCNWKLLQQVLDGKSIPAQKRRRQSNSTLNRDAKRQKLAASTSNDTTSPLNPINSKNNSDKNSSDSKREWTDDIIDSIKKQQSEASKKNGPEVAWFDNVDPFLLEDDVVMSGSESPGQLSSGAEESSGSESDVAVDMDRVDQYFENAETTVVVAKQKKLDVRKERLEKSAVAMDCEMVGVGLSSSDSALARVSIVDRLGAVLYDKYVKPVEAVTDYRTQYSGIRPENLVNATPFAQVQAEVAKLLLGRLLVGHALKNDMHCLMLSHPTHSIRDTSMYQPFRKMYNKFSPSLKNLCKDVLGVAIQEGEHDSVTDARAAMRLYTMHREAWESDLSSGGRGHFKNSTMAGVKRFKGAPGSRKKQKPKREGGRFARKLSTKNRK